jgi:hypothetical protein
MISKLKRYSIIPFFLIGMGAFSQQIGDGRALTLENITVPLKSGIYQALNPIGTIPDMTYSGWQHLLITRHSNDLNNHQLQIGSAFTTNDRLFFRKIADYGLASQNPSWIELATRGINNFIGDQSINGNVAIGANSASFYQHGGNNKIVEIHNSNTSSNSQSHIVLSTGSTNPNSSIGSLTWAMPNVSSTNKGVAYLGVTTDPNSSSSNPSSSMVFATRSIFNDNWKANMIISSDGNVGIGTTVPNSKLVIASSDYGITINPNALAGGLGFNRNALDGAIFNSSKSAWQFSARDEMFTLEGYNGPPSALFTVLKNGYIGMGTVSPGYKLDVIGTIRAREIKVDLTGADFVFENEYKLMPLTELEKFIKINKHLPEIATAKEMQENGANLGDLNTKLLQKIEELTLYTIEQNKKLEKQNEKILLLEKKVKTIELATK